MYTIYGICSMIIYIFTPLGMMLLVYKLELEGVYSAREEELILPLARWYGITSATA